VPVEVAVLESELVPEAQPPVAAQVQDASLSHLHHQPGLQFHSLVTDFGLEYGRREQERIARQTSLQCPYQDLYGL
jgi:hypothetical protein